MANEFLVSVANAILRDPNTGNAIMYGKANISSAFTMSMTATEVRGGINNPLLYSYYHDKKLEIKVEDATFSQTMLALNAGASVLTGSVNVTKTDCIVLSASGSGVLTATPVGNVTVFLPNGSIQTVTPSTKDITVSGGANLRVDAVYISAMSADQLTIETTTPPSVVDMTLLAELRDNTNVIVKYLQIQIPRFQISGNYTLAFAANGVSNQSLDGMALETYSTDCASGNYYAKVTWIPATAAAVPVSSIAAVPATLSFVNGAPATTKQITVYSLRGGVYAPAVITTSCSFVASAVVGGFTVGLHTGVVSSASPLSASAVATITCTYYDATSGSLTDVVPVNVV